MPAPVPPLGFSTREWRIVYGCLHGQPDSPARQIRLGWLRGTARDGDDRPENARRVRRVLFWLGLSQIARSWPSSKNQSKLIKLGRHDVSTMFYMFYIGFNNVLEPKISEFVLLNRYLAKRVVGDIRNGVGVIRFVVGDLRNVVGDIRNLVGVIRSALTYPQTIHSPIPSRKSAESSRFCRGRYTGFGRQK